MVLDNLTALADRLGELAGTTSGFDTVLPVIGLSPGDVAATQIGDLRRVVNELRTGPPVAVRCGIEDTDPPVGSAQSAQVGDVIYCRATTIKPTLSAEWDVTGLSELGGPVDVLSTVGITPTDSIALIVDTLPFTLRLNFTDSDGPHTAEFPDPRPETLQQLETFLEGGLGLGSGALVFAIDDVDADLVNELVVRLEVSACTATTSRVDACTADARTILEPPVRVSVDVDELSTFGGLIALATASIGLQQHSTAQLDIAIPLPLGAFDPASVVGLYSSGLEVQLGFDGGASGIPASLGALMFSLDVSGADMSVVGALETIGGGATFDIASVSATSSLAGLLLTGCSGGGHSCASLTLDHADLLVPATVVFLAPDIADDSTWDAGLPAELSTLLSSAVFDFELISAPLFELADLVAQGMDGEEAGVSASLVGDKLDAGADVEGSMDDVALQLSGIGLALQVDVATLTHEEVAIFLADAIDDVGSTNPDVLLSVDPGSILIECNGGLCGTDDVIVLGSSTLDDLRIQFEVDASQFDAVTPIDTGLPALPVRIAGNVVSDVLWTVLVDFGIDRLTGPYLVVSGVDHSDPEVSLSASGELVEDLFTDFCFASVPSPLPAGVTAPTSDDCLPGELGYNEAALWDITGGTTLGLITEVDITGAGRLRLAELVAGGAGLDTTLGGTYGADLLFRTGDPEGDASAPPIIGVLHLGMAGGAMTAPVFDTLHLDGDAYSAQFIDPIFGTVRDVASPLQPVADTFLAPLPIVSDLSDLVGGDPITLLSLLGGDADTTLIERLLTLARVARAGSGVSGLIPLGSGGLVGGSFEIDLPLAEGPPLGQSLLGDLITGADLRPDLLDALGIDDPDAAYGVPGLEFPVFETEDDFYGLFVRRDTTLSRFDAGTVSGTAGLSESFGPIFVGPIPLVITMSGSVRIEGRFSLGFDTSGLGMPFETGSGGRLIQGIFLNDLDSAGNDVPEISIIGEFVAGAGVSFAIVSAGVQGGVQLTVVMDLDDRPIPDGQLRITEILTRIDNPICLFVTSGSLDAFLSAYVRISFAFYDKTFSWRLAQVNLLDFSSACEPPKPVLAESIPALFPPKPEEFEDVWDPEPIGFILRLNMGPADRREARQIAIDEIDEQFTVRQLSPDGPTVGGVEALPGGALPDFDTAPEVSGVSVFSYSVSAFGLTQEYLNIVRIDAIADDGNDVLSFLPGVIENDLGEQVTFPFGVPVVVDGGTGNDRITSGIGDDRVSGGPGRDRINTGLGNDELWGGPDGDVLNGGRGSDTIHGDAQPPADVGPALPEGEIFFDGNDILIGGPGSDSLFGNGGNDEIMGGPGSNTPFVDPDPLVDPTLDGADLLVGGAGNDNLEGHWGDDTLYGDDQADCGASTSVGDDQLFGGFGDDTLIGGPGDDLLVGEQGDDTIFGCDGDDALDGDDDLLGTTDGDDFLDAGDGDDEARGRGGDDDIFGGPGNDNVVTDPITGLSIGGLFGGGGVDYVSGGPGNDWVEGNDGDDVLTGDETTPPRGTTKATFVCSDVGGEDTVLGGDGDDLMCGEGGADVMDGGAGEDFMHGNAGSDTMRGNTEDDEMFGDAGDDNMFGDSGNDRMFGGLNNDTIRGGIGDDYLEGNENDDTLWGGAGQDDIIGGSSSELPDGSDTVFGLADHDVIAGDNATITRPLGAAPNSFDGSVVRDVTLLGGGFGGDELNGAGGNDRIFAQGGDDLVRGGNDHDFIEGNAGADTLFGNTGQDDIVGGGSLHVGTIVSHPPIVPTTAGLLDGADVIDGGDDFNVIVGDNGRIGRPLDGGEWIEDTAVPGFVVREVVLFDVLISDPAVAGGDTIIGGSVRDLLFGQAGDDEIEGREGDDYIEGNQGNDTVSGGLGGDDVVGGSASLDGVLGSTIPAGFVASTITDGADIIDGYADDDVIVGDNGRISRPPDAGGAWRIDPNAGGFVIRLVVLFDVNSPDMSLSGGDTIRGGSDRDFLFGQGDDDTVEGGEGDDYIEGNHGADALLGDAGEDDIAGGGSSIDGVIDDDRDGNGLKDGADTIEGGDDADVSVGDNGRISRPTDAGGLWGVDPNAGGFVVRLVVLFDVNALDSSLSGGDIILGGPDRDLLFGQGGDDAVEGGGGDDYIEGNHGADNLLGDAGEDDIVGGGSAIDGVIDDDRDGNGLLDGADTVDGGADHDVLAGDNVLITRLIDPDTLLWLRDEDNGGFVLRMVHLFDVNDVVSSVFGGDTMFGRAGLDLMFGQAGDDEMHGGLDDDYMEGNHGADTMWGNAGQDDLIGGGSANDGWIGGGAPADGLLDGGDTIYGGHGADAGAADGDTGADGADVIAGDNAQIERLSSSPWLTHLTTGDIIRSVILFDVQTVAGLPIDPATSGGDELWGAAGHDLMFGQGNGLQVDGDGDGLLDEDPADLVDNDRDGRESGDPLTSDGYDCEDGIDNDGDELVDGADTGCWTAIDEDGGGDVMHGGDGDDHMEGNHGSDLMFGDGGEDDLIGGSTEGIGLSGGSEVFGGVVPANLLDAHDVIYGGDEDDVIVGDNAAVIRSAALEGPWITRSGGIGPSGGPFDFVVRGVVMGGAPGFPLEDPGAFGNDYIAGDAGEDDLYGQFGSDFLAGGPGEDALVGDQGLVTKNIIGDGVEDAGLPIGALISAEQPFTEDVIFPIDTLLRRVELFAFVTGDPRNGDDTLLGGDNGDSLHGGAGDDLMNGNAGEDRLFGGDDDDVAWGGPDHDHLFGGHGADTLDVRPRSQATYGHGGNALVAPRDPPEWFTYAGVDHYQQGDFIYGGFDRDIMQTNDDASAIGPNDVPQHDRLIDWTGAFNLFLICEPLYGEWMITRVVSPGTLQFLQDLAWGDGALDPAAPGTSGFRELGLVFPGADMKANAGKAHPGTPGHFVCDDTPDGPTAGAGTSGSNGKGGGKEKK